MGKPNLVVQHESKGKYVAIRPGQKVFVRDQGNATDPVVLLVHGVPSSSFLYERMFDKLAAKGLRAISFDFPGIGLSDKPKKQDYSWKGLKDSMALVVDTLDLHEITLVVHDIGGPIGLWFAVENKERISRIVILNTLLKVSVFSPPFPMWTFRIPVLKHIAFASMNSFVMKHMMRFTAIEDGSQFTSGHAAAWMYLMKNRGGSSSFLKIMNGFELTKELEDLIADGLRDWVDIGLIWGEKEKSIPEAQLKYIEETFELKMNERVNGSHFLQVDCSEDIVNYISQFISH